MLFKNHYSFFIAVNIPLGWCKTKFNLSSVSWNSALYPDNPLIENLVSFMEIKVYSGYPGTRSVSFLFFIETFNSVLYNI